MRFALLREIRKIDPKLYIKYEGEGRWNIMRVGYKAVRNSINGVTFVSYERDDNITLPLTHNWFANGESVEWGIEPILKKLRSMDAWSRTDIMEEYFKKVEAHELSKKRDRYNKAESFFSDYRNQFKEAWKDVNTSNMQKIDVRTKRDKRIKE